MGPSLIPKVGHLPIAGKQVSIGITYSRPASLSSVYAGLLRTSLEKRFRQRGAAVILDEAAVPDIGLTVHISHETRTATFWEKFIWPKELCNNGPVKYTLIYEWNAKQKQGKDILVDLSDSMTHERSAKKIISAIERALQNAS